MSRTRVCDLGLREAMPKAPKPDLNKPVEEVEYKLDDSIVPRSTTIEYLNNDKYTRILVDDREGYRVGKCIEYWGDELCSKAHLDYADVSYLGSRVGVEIKEANDFISSTTNNKIFRQCVELSKNFEHGFIIVIGDLEKAIKKNNGIMKRKHYKTRFHMWNYYATLSSLCQVVIPFHVNDIDEALTLMDFLFEKCTDNKRRDLTPPEFKVDNPVVTYLAGVRKVNLKTASRITHALGLESLEDMLTVTETDLLGIKKIGKATAKRVIMAIYGEYPHIQYSQ